MAKRGFRAALVQHNVCKDLSENLAHTVKLIFKAATGGARLIILPEFFNSPVNHHYFKTYAESVPNGPTCKTLSKAARDNRIYLIGGSISEISDGKYYNTCTVWNPDGEMVKKYRKLHLYSSFTIDETKTFVSGDEFATFEMDNVKIGLGICYDLLFSEMATVYRLQGCDLLIYPSAFDMSLGALLWKNVQIIRAIDSQSYVLGITRARGNVGYITWGHSQVTNPWGVVLACAGYKEEIIFCDLDFTDCDKVKQQMPKLYHRRTDVYETTCK